MQLSHINRHLILMLYCCTRNYHKFSFCKPHIFIVSSFHGSEVQASLILSGSSSRSLKAAFKGWPEILIWNSGSSLIQIVSRIQFLVGPVMRCPLSCWLLAKNGSQLLEDVEDVAVPHSVAPIDSLQHGRVLFPGQQCF